MRCAAACRHGATSVLAVESSGHVADLAEQVLAENGFSDRCTVTNKDARFLQLASQDKKGQRRGEVPRPVDMLVFEVGGGEHAMAACTRSCDGRCSWPAPHAQPTQRPTRGLACVMACCSCTFVGCSGLPRLLALAACRLGASSITGLRDQAQADNARATSLSAG